MATFPLKESEIVALAETMVAGLTAHAADFPSVTVATLSTALTNYKNQRQSQENAKSQAQIATVTKDLKLSEVDVANDPEKLTEIGWKPRSEPQPIIAPGSPTELHPISEGQGNIWLEWEKPATGGAVRNYIIERRQQPTGGGEFGAWSLCNTTYNCEIRLTEQPENVRLEYRVKAANTAGESLPSNSISVVLP
jgi:hypothetical protein